MKSKVLVTIVAIIGLIFGLIGLILCFFPLGTIDIVPAGVGLIFGLLAFFLAKKSGTKKKLIFMVLIISVFAILISIFTELFVKNEVANDAKFEDKIEKSAEESVDDLEEAFEDLDNLDIKSDSSNITK